MDKQTNEEIQDNNNVLSFKPMYDNYLDDIVLSRHIENLTETYGEARLFKVLEDAYGLKIVQKAG